RLTIEHLEEEEDDGTTPRGTPKHWHIWHLVVRKPNRTRRWPASRLWPLSPPLRMLCARTRQPARIQRSVLSDNTTVTRKRPCNRKRPGRAGLPAITAGSSSSLPL